jgi:hypothetical protein
MMVAKVVMCSVESGGETDDSGQMERDHETLRFPPVCIEKKNLIEAYSTKKERYEQERKAIKHRHRSLSPVKFSHNLPPSSSLKYLQTLHDTASNDQV